MKAGLVLLATVAVALAVSQGRVGAQSAEVLTTGVVVNVAAASSGQLESFSISDSEGRVVRFTVQAGASPTEYGLENQAGDRWTSDQAQEPVEAVRRPGP